MNPEPESIISFAIARAIREHPELAAAEMLKLIRAQASLQAELFFLREKLRELVNLAKYKDLINWLIAEAEENERTLHHEIMYRLKLAMRRPSV